MNSSDTSDLGSSGSSRRPKDYPSGLLHVEFDYPLDGLEELHDWYNTEHIPERLSIPGFVTGRRYTAVEGAPRWLALYELDSPAVLETPEYCRYKGEDETVWTKRILLTSRPSFRRSVHELLWSESASTGGPKPPGPPGLFSLRVIAPTSGASTALLDEDSELRTLLSSPGVTRARLYRDLDAPNERLFLADLDGVWAVQSAAFREGWSRLAAGLAERSPRYARGVYVLIL